MNEEQAALIDSLRDDGFTVIVFTPDEMRNVSQVDKSYMENLLVVAGRKLIAYSDQGAGVIDACR